MELNYLSHMNYRQVQKLRKKTNIALLPMGPTEVHGPHLPLMVDVVSAEEITERVAKKLKEKGIETLIAPTINYALADIAHSFNGNTTLRFETVAYLIEDICLSLSKWDFDRIMLICSHGEPRNMEGINEGIRRATEKREGLVAAASNWLSEGMPKIVSVCKGEHPEWDLHAGEFETALMLMKHPELVDKEELKKLEPNWEGEHLFKNIAEGKKTWTELGAPLAYLGDPRSATAETGEKCYDIFSDIVVEEVLELQDK